MNLVWLLCFILLRNNEIVECKQKEYITIWSPQTVYDEKDYNIVILSNNVDIRTELTFKFRSSVGTLSISNEKVQKVCIKNPNKSGKAKYELDMILYRNMTVPSGKHQMCMTQTVKEIKAEMRQYYTFIQTDKPIYKPDDTVRFRVVVVDRDLKPYHMNNIDIYITDSFNRPVKVFDDLGEDFLGVLSESFRLSSNTPLGIWKIRAVIDRVEQWETTKEFAVSKKTLPSFAVYANVKEKHILTNSYLRLQFFAKYSFDEYVHGNAQLTITCTTNNQVILSTTFNSITGIENVKYNANSQLKAVTTDKLNYKALIVFTEAYSGMSANKTIEFTVHGNNKPKMQAIHPENFLPGYPFGIRVFVHDWMDRLIEKTHERVRTSFRYTIVGGGDNEFQVDGIIENGVAVINFLVPENAIRLDVTVKYVAVVYEKTIKKGDLVVGVNKIAVDYMPKNPKHESIVTVHVRAISTEINQLVGIVMSRHGNIESHQIYCNFNVNCKFNFTIKKDMMPECKVVVYYVQDSTTIFQGEVTVTTDELSRNTLDIDLPETAELRKPANMSITTKPNSTVYLLGYDERLNYLFQGNEIKKNDVVEELANYDGQNAITVFHIKNLNWKKCTEAELMQINKGRIYTSKHIDGNTIEAEEEEDELNREALSKPNQDEQIKPAANDIREDFREVLLFKEFVVSDGFLMIDILPPDSITSWSISSFSMNTEFGLAIGPSKKLVVKSQFFVRTNLPYSIRFKERLQVDVMVHNYLENEEEINVAVKMHDLDNKNRLRFFDTPCSTEAVSGPNLSKNVHVAYNDIKKVSFYIQYGGDNINFEQNIKIMIDAVARTKNGSIYNDKMIKKLRVELVGVKIYDYKLKKFHLKPNKDPQIDVFNKNITAVDEYPRLSVKIAGDYMTDDMANVNFGHEINPDHCLEQRTSLIKGNVEQFRYLKSKNANPSTRHFSVYYQSTLEERVRKWNYATSSGFRAHFIEAIASAMEIGALPSNIPIIENELNLLQNQQTSSGNFNNFGNFPTSRDSYFQTAFILIPFLKLRKFVNKNYENVINRGFSYLEGITSISATDKETNSIAAYAYVLNGNEVKAKELLLDAERFNKTMNQNKKCLTNSLTDNNCNIRHTSYTVIAYVAMNMINEAKSYFSYIYDEYKLDRVQSNTYFYAVSAEAISKFLIARLPSLKTDITVTLTNDGNFTKTVHITKENQKNEIEVIYPDYSLEARIAVKGSGFCTITKIIESTVALDKSSSKFRLSVTSSKGSRTYENIVKVCATYQPNENEPSLHTLISVIYDVEMPSGYVFKEIVNLSRKPEIRKTDVLYKSTRVQIYFDDFKSGINHCAEIAATKIFDVKDTEKAGVIVFDYYEKNNLAVDFYKFENSC